MNSSLRHGVGLLVLLFVTGATPAGAQETTPSPVLTVPATGTFARGGEFTGTISINRFERRGNDIVALGFVSGVLSRGSRTLGTAIVGEVTWPVRVGSGGFPVANGRGTGPAAVVRAAWSSSAQPAGTLRLVQAGACPVLNVTLGPNNVDLLGAQVALSGVTLDLSGAAGTPLGDLVCAAADLVGNVARLVNVLNSILGLVTGLLGGLTGGIGGGIVPMQ